MTKRDEKEERENTCGEGDEEYEWKDEKNKRIEEETEVTR